MQNQAYLKIFDRFSKHVANNHRFSGRTKFNYPKVVEYYLSYLETFGIFCLNEANQELMLKFVKFKGEQAYATSYVNLRLSALKIFYTWAYKNKLCNNHLILEYKKSRLNHSILSIDDENEESSAIITLSSEEQAKILNLSVAQEFVAIRNKCIVDLLLASAIYANELTCLPVTALNLKQSCIDIVDTNKDRRIQLDIGICRESCENWLHYREKALPNPSRCTFLFFTKDLEQLTKRRLYEIVSQYLIKAGITKGHLGADILRQTAICNMFRNQRTLEEVQLATRGSGSIRAKTNGFNFN